MTPVSVCHHVSACVFGASTAFRGYFSRGRPARRLRSKLAVGHARRAGRARPGGSARGRFPAWGRGVGRRAARSSRRVGASVGRRGTRPRRGLRKKKKDKKTNRTPRNARRGSGRRPRPRGTTATPAVARVGVGAARRWRRAGSSVARREDDQRTKGTPPKGLGVDRLADGAQQLERRARRGRDGVVAGAHECADRRRRRVEVRDLVLVDDAPEAARVGPRRDPFEHDLRRAVQQRPVGDVGVARDPAAVGRAEPDVVRARRRVEDRPERVARADHVAARRVDDALGRARAAGRVEDEERVLGGHPLDVAVVRRRDDVVPPRLVGGELRFRVRGVVEAPQDDRAARDRRALVPRLRACRVDGVRDKQQKKDAAKTQKRARPWRCPTGR